MIVPEGKRFSTTLGGRELVIETGKYAKQVSGSVTVRYGESLVLVTAHMSESVAATDFLPLTVEYEERHYAIGKIPGSFMRREGRPGTQAVLNARITDRQIRPLFPKGLRNEVQVIATVLAADRQNDPGLLAAIGASAALHMSHVPWDGPTACLSIGYASGEYVINPTLKELEEESLLELTVAGTRDAVLMVEASAAELDEKTMIGAIEFAHNSMQPVLELIENLRAEAGEAKAQIALPPSVSEEERAQIASEAQAAGLRDALLVEGKHERSHAVKAIRDRIIERLAPDPSDGEFQERVGMLKDAFRGAEQQLLRNMVLAEDLRSDGRRPEDIRPIWIEPGLVPTAHGSAVFTRGETQVLAVATLGTGKDNRLIDDLGIEEHEEFMLHYNFPPYSTGEVKRLRGVSRREVGHGNLARRALERQIPQQDVFPYVIRIVAETLESNGSSSMATVCAASMSLMDAGVPMRAPVAGIAMGLVKDDANYRILSDILGSEDALGDMDFKVTGTRAGITALQMDIKIKGITPEIMLAALEQAKDGRYHILDAMENVLPHSRTELSPRAPRIVSVRVPVDKIGVVIGPGGKQVRELESYGVSIDISEDGTIRIYSEDAEAAERAKREIEALTATAEVGKVYEGTVAKVLDFGAFITLFPGTDGLLHVSQIAEGRVDRVEDHLKVGDKITVKVANIDDRGKIDLLRPELEGKIPRRAPPVGSRGGPPSGRGRREGRR